MTSSSAVILKVGALLTQLALGWFLSSDDFGLYALAIGFSSLVGLIRDGGAGRLLIQRPDEFRELAPSLLKLAVTIGLFTAGALVLGAPLVARSYKAPQLIPMLTAMAVGVGMAPILSLYRAKLSSDLRFSTLARINVAATSLKYLITVCLAGSGVGAMSFAWPVPVAALIEFVLLRREAGPMPARRESASNFAGGLLGGSAWITAGAAANALGLQGHYLVLGAMVARPTLGVYFFGYQLGASLAELFGASFRVVVMPALVKVKEDPARQYRGFGRALSVAMLAAAAVCAAATMLAEWAVDLLWSGKWNDAVGVVQVIAVGTLARVPSILSFSLIEAQGRWRSAAVASTLEAAAILMAAGAGAAVGTPIAIASAIAAQQLVSAAITTAIALRKESHYLLQAVASWLPPVLIAAVPLLGYFLLRVRSTQPLSFSALAICLLALAISYWVGARRFLRPSLVDLLATLRTRR